MSDQPRIQHTTLACGVVVITEHMPSMASVSAAWLTPVGSSGDPEGAAGEGESAMCAELLLRGTINSTSQELANRLDVLGVQRNASAGMHHVNLAAVTTRQFARDMLVCLAEMVRHPRMDDEGVEHARALGLQAIAAVADDPQQVCMQALSRVSMPAPFNRSGLGTPEGLAALTAQGLRQAWTRRGVPGGSIIGIAGAINHNEACDALEHALHGWTGTAPSLHIHDAIKGARHFERKPTSQAHLALSLSAPNGRSEHRHAMRIAARVLGGGSSSRLFDEVRERRGLCYSVGAAYSAGRDLGRLTIYAGSRPDRAQETLDCIQRELERFAKGIERDECERARIGMLSKLMMSEESTGARAMALASDWFTFGHTRSTDVVARDLSGVTLDQVNQLVALSCGAAWRDDACRSVVAPDDLA